MLLKKSSKGDAEGRGLRFYGLSPCQVRTGEALSARLILTPCRRRTYSAAGAKYGWRGS
jgi:hypothetical protein